MDTLKNQLENSNKEKVNVVDAITKALKREKMLKKDLVALKRIESYHACDSLCDYSRG